MTATLTSNYPTQTGSETGYGLGLDHQTESLPTRFDVHSLTSLDRLCQPGEDSDLVIDASNVRFIDTAGLEFLDRLETMRSHAGATVLYYRPSPALVATLSLHGVDLSEQKVIFA